MILPLPVLSEVFLILTVFEDTLKKCGHLSVYRAQECIKWPNQYRYDCNRLS